MLWATFLSEKVLVYLQPPLRSAPRKLPNSVKQRKIRAITQLKVIQGHRFGTNRKLIYDFLLVINTNLAPILHRLAFESIGPKSLPILRLTPPTEGFPWDDLRKIFRGCQCMAKVPNGVETLPKISTDWVRRTNVTYRQTGRHVRQTTDGRATAYREREREFTFAKKL